MSHEAIGSFGEHLRRYREQAGLTQEALAERAGLTTNAIGALERGERRRPYPHTVRSLADALELSDEQRTTLFQSASGRSEPSPKQAASSLLQIPSVPTDILGRSTETSVIAQLLRRPSTRLLTLIGPGGVGKTRLAIEVASYCVDQFAAGAAFVPLAPLERPDLVIPTIVRTLGLQETGSATSLQTLTRWLHDRRFLLILDNVEHVLAAALDLARLLQDCPQLSVLATSREALRIRGEQEYPVPSLTFPQAQGDYTAEQLLHFPAIQLFVQRAQAVRPEFELSETNADQIAQICARLDGLPLAIELAAARAALLSPQMLLSRLDQQLQLLSGGARDLPARQQTMRATIAWSYELLSPAEQRLFRQLAIVAQGATPDAIEAICRSDDEDLMTLLTSLVHKQLVKSPIKEQTQFSMLETIRAFAFEELKHSADYVWIVQAHAHYFLGIAERASPHLMGKDQIIWLKQLTLDLPNLRAAAGYLMQQQAYAESVRLIWALWRFWWLRGLHHEVRQWTRDLREIHIEHSFTLREQAQIALTIGSMSWTAGDMAEAEDFCEQARQLSAAQGDKRLEAIACMMLGSTITNSEMSTSEAPMQSEALQERAISLFGEINELWGVAICMAYTAQALLKRGMVAAALARCDSAIPIAQRSGDSIAQTQLLFVIGLASQIRGDDARAIQAFVEGFRRSITINDSVNLGYFIKGIAELAIIHSDTARSTRLLGAAESLMAAIGVPFHRDTASQIWHTQLLAQTRGMLGDEAFAQLWAEGHRLNVQQATEEAEMVGAMLMLKHISQTQAESRRAPEQRQPLLGFARSKLQPPRSRTDLVVRERLLKRIQSQLPNTRLLLISAQAGAGKTTLLANTVAALGHPYSWISLDKDDNDLPRFAALLFAALDTLAPGLERSTAQLIEQGRASGTLRIEQLQPALDHAINLLIETLAEPCLLILDDLHTLNDAQIYRVLDYLLEYLPARLSIAIGARHDPPLNLSRLRARRELLDLRLAELHFTLDETRSLLNEQLQLELSAEQVQILHAQSEGWAAGLSLFAASLDTISEAQERERFLHSLGRAEPQLFDYLAEEVLSRQEPFIRSFLLETSILPVLTPQACIAVTGLAYAASVLDDLYQRNLFLGRFADEQAQSSQASYRYHDLFRSFLQTRLRTEAPDWFRQLHERAARAESDPLQQIAHYQLAENWPAMAARIEQIGDMLLAEGAFERLYSWIDALPAELQSKHPRLQLWHGIGNWQRLQVEPARRDFALAKLGFVHTGDALGQGEVLAWQALDQNLYGDFGLAQTTVAQALALPLPPQLRVRMLVSRSIGLVLNGQWQQSLITLDEAVTLAESSPEPQVIDNLLIDLATPLSAVPGGTALFERALQLANLYRPGVRPLSTQALDALTRCWRGDLAGGMAEQRLIGQLVDQHPARAWQALNSAGLMTLFSTILGKVEADPALLTLIQSEASRDNAFAHSLALYFQFHAARAAWLQSDPMRLMQISKHIQEHSQGVRVGFVVAINHLLEAILALSANNLSAAEEPLQAAAALQEQLQFTILAADAYILLAHLRLRQQRRADALAFFGPRLSAYAQDQTPGQLVWQSRLIIPLLELAIEQQHEVAFARQILQLLGE